MSRVTERHYGHEWERLYGVWRCRQCGTRGDIRPVDPRCKRPELTGVERRSLENLRWRVRRGEVGE